MASRKEEESHLSILDAVETLSMIADTDFEREVDVATVEEIAEQNQMITARTVRWLDYEDPDQTVDLIKDTFHVVLEYLRNFYKNEYRYAGKPQAEEGVKTIMVLVGEAAQKLDKYTTIFSRTKTKKVCSLAEYKELQEFYLTRIAKKIEEGVLGKWILALTRDAMERRKKVKQLKRRPSFAEEHVFIDLESVINDIDYELFFMKKQDGSRFYNPRLIRNIKLICDFGGPLGGTKVSDPFHHLNIWQDQSIHLVVKYILQAQGDALDRFLHEAKKHSSRSLVGKVNKTIMALLLSSNPKNLLRNTPVKSCQEYFVDFLGFLRKALKSREYQRCLAYPARGAARLAHSITDVLQGLSRALFTRVPGHVELLPVFEEIFHEAEELISPEHLEVARETQMLWSRLASDYAAMKKLIRLHPNGPMIKDLNFLEHEALTAFDPIRQYNLPFRLYSLHCDDLTSTHIHCPTPVYQEFINNPKILDEYRAFLRSYFHGPKKRKHLIINFQDRTSWREHDRCVVLEQLQKKREFKNVLTVVTMPKDTDFYHQEGAYQQDHQAVVFLEHFKEHLMDEQCGFYLPKGLAKDIFSKFVNRAFKAIHNIFFEDMNVLSERNRRDFIEIFYLFLELKLIDMVRPDTFSMMSKDGLDVGVNGGVILYAFLKILNKESLSEEEIEQINFMIYLPALLIRERIPIPESFERTLNALKCIEDIQHDLGKKKFRKLIQKTFGKLYNLPIFEDVTAVLPMK